MAPGRYAERPATEAGGSVTTIPAPSGGGGTLVGCPAVITSSGRSLSAPHADTPAAEAENLGSIADLAVGTDGAAACPLYHRRPALDRPFDAGVPHSAGGPGADGPALDRADLSTRVSATVGLAHASYAHRVAAPAPAPGRGNDRAGNWGKSPALSCASARSDEDRWCPAVRGRTDQDSAGIRPAAGNGGALCTDGPLAPAGYSRHATGLAYGPAGSPGDGQNRGSTGGCSGAHLLV